MSDRKATDVLLDIEKAILELKSELAQSKADTKNLINQQKNNEFLLKTILSKLNSGSSQVVETPKEHVAVEFPEIDSLPNDNVVVFQKITYPDGRYAPLANVKIIKNGNVIATKLTSSTGKWTQVLTPGEYDVHITKAPVEGKPIIDVAFKLNVPKGVKQLEVPFQNKGK